MTSAARIGKVRTEPRDYFERLRAPDHPLTDDEKKIALAEIARRHDWHDKQRREASPLRLFTVARVEELEREFADRNGLYLPDDDSGWDDFTIMANHLAHFGGTTERNVARIVEWAGFWAPEFPSDRVTNRAKLIAAKPLKWKADKLASRLGLTMERRTRLKVKTIGAIDVKPEDRPAWLQKYHRQRKEAERRAEGVLTRAEWLANTDTAKKWWELLGMSRRTWQRKGKPMPETASGAGPAVPARGAGPADNKVGAGPADYILRIRSAGPVPNPDGQCPGAAPGLVQSEAATDSAPILDQLRRGGETAHADELNPSASPSPRAAVSLPCEDGQRLNPWTSPSPPPLGCCMAGWEVPPVGPASIVLLMPHLRRADGYGRVPINQRWTLPMKAFAAAVRADGMKGTILHHGSGRLMESGT